MIGTCCDGDCIGDGCGKDEAVVTVPDNISSFLQLSCTLTKGIKGSNIIDPKESFFILQKNLFINL